MHRYTCTHIELKRFFLVIIGFVLISQVFDLIGWLSDDEPLDKLRISNDPISLDSLDIHNIEPKKIETIPDLLLDDIEVL